MTNKPPLIFVYIGKHIPSYAYHSLNFAVENSKLEVILISDAKPKHFLNKSIEYFHYESKDNEPIKESRQKFRDGFWLKTTQRFYAIQQFLAVSNIERFFHAELDNLIFNISTVGTQLDLIESGLFVPRASEEHALASLMYVNSKVVFDEFCQFSRSFEYAYNDMEILAKYLDSNPAKGFSLPSNPDSAATLQAKYKSIAPQSVGLFDAAALGQWYFGVDPRNTYRPVHNLFHNDWHAGNLSDYRLERDYPNCQIMISSKSESFLKLRLHNLHVHSKILKRLVVGNGLDQIIQRTNEGSSTLISLNLKSKFRWVKDMSVAIQHKLVRNPHTEKFKRNE